jgi:peptidoglycan/LPS O-acetylase OafA/YrhL
LHLTPQDSPSLIAAIEAPVFCALSFAAAYVSFELFQRPVAGLRRRFGAETRPTVAMDFGDVMQQVQSEAVRIDVEKR